VTSLSPSLKARKETAPPPHTYMRTQKRNKNDSSDGISDLRAAPLLHCTLLFVSFLSDVLFFFILLFCFTSLASFSHHSFASLWATISWKYSLNYKRRNKEEEKGK
jgi:hypothetical protein